MSELKRSGVTRDLNMTKCSRADATTYHAAIMLSGGGQTKTFGITDTIHASSNGKASAKDPPTPPKGSP